MDLSSPASAELTALHTRLFPDSPFTSTTEKPAHHPTSLVTLLDLLSERILHLKNDLNIANNNNEDETIHMHIDTSTLRKDAVAISNKLIQPSSLKIHDYALATAKAQHEERAKSMHELAGVLEMMCLAQESFHAYDGDLLAGHLDQALSHLQELVTLEESMKRLDKDTGAVCQIIRTQTLLRRTELQNITQELITNAFIMNNEGAFTIHHCPSFLVVVNHHASVSLHASQQCLQEFGRERLTLILTQFRDEFLVPLMNGIKACQIASCTFSLVSCEVNSTTISAIKTRFDNVLTALQFISTIMLDGNETLISQASLIFWTSSNLMNLAITALNACMQNNNTDTYSYEFVQEFQQQTLKLGFIHPSSMHALSNWVAHLEDHTCEKRRCDILLAVRHAMKNDDGIPIKCQDALGKSVLVSRGAAACAEIANQTMIEASTSSHRSKRRAAQVLYETSRDCFVLFKTLAVMLLPNRDHNVLEVALLHNNLLYLGREVTFLGHRYRHKFPAEEEFKSTVDLAPWFLDEADRIWQTEMKTRQDLVSNLAYGGKLNESASYMDELIQEWGQVLSQEVLSLARHALLIGFSDGCISSLCMRPPIQQPHRTQAKEMKMLVNTMINMLQERDGGEDELIKRFRAIDAALEPHVSFPIFVDMVNEDRFMGFKPAELVGLARVLFASTTSRQEIEEWEKTIF